MVELGEYAWSWTALAIFAQYFRFKALVISCFEETRLVVGHGPFLLQKVQLREDAWSRGEIFSCRHCQQQCIIFASGVNFSIFTNFLCFFLLKLLKLGDIDGVKFLA